jgi:hypothetical protein
MLELATRPISQAFIPDYRRSISLLYLKAVLPNNVRRRAMLRVVWNETLSQPFRLDNQTAIRPRALPWARLSQPFRLKAKTTGLENWNASFQTVLSKVDSTKSRSFRSWMNR